MDKLQRAIDLIEQDEWDQAHNLVQDGNNKYYYLIHGLLHRIEGDISNAQYWYNRANEPLPDNTTDAETDRIKTFIKHLA
ncbi:hypothetical protein [Neptuniibacter sp. 2_MG-2023]|uniref:hypothetical protein n=1 Tax=Neptuniibacter sp. 2_MG-2023 TaxID=3062671 RepID=UPI0026E146D4|nr:hypothetical protein [Neptuniibacter sp. 2_MG-2023]MDO6513605.1 hypothetical protein [Neptuniibacter sp. 2_MG-2023]